MEATLTHPFHTSQLVVGIPVGATFDDILRSDAKKKEKKEFGKLPKISKEGTATSRDAAADMLKKFFNRR